jgi:hypothetical protein
MRMKWGPSNIAGVTEHYKVDIKVKLRWLEKRRDK